MDALPAVAPDKLIALMIAGAVFSLAGLWLLFRPAKEGEAAKIELFGLKFQSSSAGLLVFLVGATFFVGGIVLPESKDDDLAQNFKEAAPVEEAEVPLDRETLPPGGTITWAPTYSLDPDYGMEVRYPDDVAETAMEIESNNRLTEANILKPGLFVEGVVDVAARDQYDWFVAPLEKSGDVEVEVQVRLIEKIDSYPSLPADCTVTVYDEKEQKLGGEYINSQGSKYITTFADDNKFLLIRIASWAKKHNADLTSRCIYNVKYK